MSNFPQYEKLSMYDHRIGLTADNKTTLNNMKVKIKREHQNAVIPKLATKGSACVDVVATKIMAGTANATVYLGFSAEIPEGYKAVMSPRSSFGQKGWVLQNSPCQIDSDYRGEWIIKFEAIPKTLKINKPEFSGSFPYSLVYSQFPYKEGDRVAQVWLEKVIPLEFEEVYELSETERGAGGFGSTGL